MQSISVNTTIRWRMKLIFFCRGSRKNQVPHSGSLEYDNSFSNFFRSSKQYHVEIQRTWTVGTFLTCLVPMANRCIFGLKPKSYQIRLPKCLMRLLSLLVTTLFRYEKIFWITFIHQNNFIYYLPAMAWNLSRSRNIQRNYHAQPFLQVTKQISKSTQIQFDWNFKQRTNSTSQFRRKKSCCRWNWKFGRFWNEIFSEIFSTFSSWYQCWTFSCEFSSLFSNQKVKKKNFSDFCFHYFLSLLFIIIY